MKNFIKTLLSTILISLLADGVVALTSSLYFAKPGIPLGQVILMNANTLAQANTNPNQGGQVRLINGWATPENWGVWSTQSPATLSLPKPKGTPQRLILNVRALVNTKHPTQLVNILIAGKPRTQITLTQEDHNTIAIPVSNADFEDRQLTITLELPNLISPAALGIGQDQRPLAIGLKSFEFQ